MCRNLTSASIYSKYYRDREKGSKGQSKHCSCRTVHSNATHLNAARLSASAMLHATDPSKLLPASNSRHP